MTTIAHEIRLKRTPQRMPQVEDFELAKIDLPPLKEGEVLVENDYVSVDPYMRGRMSGFDSYVTGFKPGDPIAGGCVGKVVASASPDFVPGDTVLSMRGWRDRYMAPAHELKNLKQPTLPASYYLGIAGMPGLTAYVGLLHHGALREGETVFVSGAAGAVGSAVCQIAKIQGAKVIASVGSERKLQWLRDANAIDEGLIYSKTPDLRAELKRLAPAGIDVFFDNVGGDHLEAAIARMRDFGRIVLCGSISNYNDKTQSHGPKSFGLVIMRRLMLKGFVVFDHYDLEAAFLNDMTAWVTGAQMKVEETIVDGLENAPKAFLGLFSGENLGKMVVRVSGRGV